MKLANWMGALGVTLLALAAGAAVAASSANSATAVTAATAANTGGPRHLAQNKDPRRAVEYGKMCAAMIGKIRPFSCLEGTIVPITVDGKTPASYRPGMTCDRPALLPYGEGGFGQCTPYSRLLDLSYGKTQISAMCRREQLRDQDSPYFDEVDIVAHNADNGETCWFHSESGPGQKLTGFDASRVPPPDEVKPPAQRIAAGQFWWSPKATAGKQCLSCHDADPFMYSPWIGQLRYLLPADPLGRYSNVGQEFAQWHSNSISTRDNTCVGCHRIGDQMSCKLYVETAAGRKDVTGGNLLSKSYPLSHWMPVNNGQSKQFWEQANLKSLNELLDCCNDPSNPVCTIKPIVTPSKAGKR
jgi:hypothetical protein